jgi:hypothetical protein
MSLNKLSSCTFDHTHQTLEMFMLVNIESHGQYFYNHILCVTIHQSNELFIQFCFWPNDDESQYDNYFIEKYNLDFGL